MDAEATADNFLQKWQFPGCIGAIDGCHIPVKRPVQEEQYINSMGWSSTILLATADDNYKFTYINIGYPGQENVNAIFETCGLKKKFEEGLHPKCHLIGDKAFILSRCMMKPVFGENLSSDKELFNDRLTQARMTVKNAFHRLKARWTVLLKFSDMQFKKIVKITTTCCILHNLCEEQNEPISEESLKKVETFNEKYPQPQDKSNWEFDS